MTNLNKDPAQTSRYLQTANATTILKLKAEPTGSVPGSSVMLAALSLSILSLMALF
jgi:hypothetical protein